jgi:uncharacterized membrane protein YfcA
MTLKQKAISQTIAIILGIVGGSLLLNVILFYTPAIILQYAFGAILGLLAVYGIYGVVYSRLEYTEKLEQINSKT